MREIVAKGGFTSSRIQKQITWRTWFEENCELLRQEPDFDAMSNDENFWDTIEFDSITNSIRVPNKEFAEQLSRSMQVLAKQKMDIVINRCFGDIDYEICVNSSSFIFARMVLTRWGYHFDKTEIFRHKESGVIGTQKELTEKFYTLGG